MKINDTRLQTIINEILPCDVLVDIGSDHGYVPVIARQKGLCNRAVATDISDKSLRKTIKLITAEKVESIDTRCGNGLEVLNAEDYDTVVISGMGGYEIIKILDKAILPFKRYILSPQQNQYECRKYLAEHNICPIKDMKIASLGKYYDIIVAESGSYTPSERELYYGKLNTEDSAKFIEHEKARLLRNYKIATLNKGKIMLASRLVLLGVDVNDFE